MPNPMNENDPLNKGNTPPVNENVKGAAEGQDNAQTPPAESEKQPAQETPNNNKFVDYKKQEKPAAPAPGKEAPKTPVAPSVYTHEKEITEKLPELVKTFENARASGLTDKEMSNSLNFLITNLQKSNKERQVEIDKQAEKNIAAMQDYKTRLEAVKEKCGENSKAYKVVEASAKDNPRYLEAIEELLVSGKVGHHDPSASLKNQGSGDSRPKILSDFDLNRIRVEREVPNKFQDYQTIRNNQLNNKE